MPQNNNTWITDRVLRQAAAAIQDPLEYGDVQNPDGISSPMDLQPHLPKDGGSLGTSVYTPESIEMWNILNKGRTNEILQLMNDYKTSVTEQSQKMQDEKFRIANDLVPPKDQSAFAKRQRQNIGEYGGGAYRESVDAMHTSFAPPSFVAPVRKPELPKKIDPPKPTRMNASQSAPSGASISARMTQLRLPRISTNPQDQSVLHERIEANKHDPIIDGTTAFEFAANVDQIDVAETYLVNSDNLALASNPWYQNGALVFAKDEGGNAIANVDEALLQQAIIDTKADKFFNANTQRTALQTMHAMLATELRYAELQQEKYLQTGLEKDRPRIDADTLSMFNIQVPQNDGAPSFISSINGEKIIEKTSGGELLLSVKVGYDTGGVLGSTTRKERVITIPVADIREVNRYITEPELLSNHPSVTKLANSSVESVQPKLDKKTTTKLANVFRKVLRKSYNSGNNKSIIAKDNVQRPGQNGTWRNDADDVKNYTYEKLMQDTFGSYAIEILLQSITTDRNAIHSGGLGVSSP
jgi:hypothetical protein